MTAPAPSRRRGRVRTLITVVGIVLVVAVAAAGSIWWFLSRPATTEADATVSDDGFTVEVATVRAEAPGGVAAPGVQVHLEHVERVEFPKDFASFASSVSSPVDLTIGEGAQPDEPVTLTFTLPEDFTGTPALLAQAGDGAEFVNSVWNAETRKLTAEVAHLSWFAPVSVDRDALGAQIGRWLDDFLGARSPQPDCYGGAVQTFEGVLSMEQEKDPVAWPCLTVDERGIPSLLLQSNSGVAWKVSTIPDGTVSTDGTLSIEGNVQAAIAEALFPPDDPSGALLPSSGLNIDFDRNPREVTLRADGGLTMIGALLFGLKMLLPDEVVDGLDLYECFAGVAEIEDADAGAARALVDCAVTALQEVASGLFGIFLAAPALLVGELEGLARNLSGRAEIVLDVYLDDAAAGAVAGPGDDTPPPDGELWYYLTDLPWIDAEKEGRVGNCTSLCVGIYSGEQSVAGTVYARSRFSRIDFNGNRFTVSWNALRACSVLDMTVGLADDSTVTEARFTIALDGGSPQELATLATGESKRVQVDLSGVYRYELAVNVSIEMSRVQSHQTAVFGNARMGCTEAMAEFDRLEG